jgi:aerobic carbon-monoxide dehydrogenase small subunit
VPKRLVRLQVNGATHSIEVWPMQRLLDVLRENLKFTGVKEGCGEGECGSCSVLLDGALVNSCLIPVCQAERVSITTVEGLALHGELHPVQQAFIDHGGTQCGFCTPGMIMAAVSLLQANPNPTEDDIRKSIAGNLCRCTGYTRIVESVIQAVQATQQVEHESVR